MLNELCCSYFFSITHIVSVAIVMDALERVTVVLLIVAVIIRRCVVVDGEIRCTLLETVGC